jgi:K(+)-stimulated pyrophosphate-energized sodium pump
MDTFLIAAGAASLLALIFAVMKFGAIMKQDQGTEQMVAISRQIQAGAKAFLTAEYKWLVVFVVIVALAIGLSPSKDGLGIQTAVAFICGALASAVAGYFGMHTATRAAVRTTQAARTGSCRPSRIASTRAS